MKISVLKLEKLETTNWSGGTTTEIYIHPQEANYQKRNFDFRLSKARVTTQESVFTPLPEVQRKLMVLEGRITLTHENQHKKQLAKLDVDSFDGAWKTSCIGKCTDFNLMMMGTTSGNLEGLQLKQNEVFNKDIPSGLKFLFLYNFSGEIDIRINDESYHLNEGDVMKIEHPKCRFGEVLALKNSTLVCVTISKI